MDEQFKPEFLTINPLGQVPALVIEHNEQKLNLVQSLAIINFLEDAYPDAPKLLPSDPLMKYRVLAIVDTICSGIQPLQNLRVICKLNSINEGDGIKFAANAIEKGFAAIEKMLEETSGKFCVGDEFTLADICLVPQVFNARIYGADVSKFPLIEKLSSELEKHPAISVSHPSKMPDSDVKEDTAF